MRDAAHFGFVIGHGVPPFAAAGARPLALVAEIHVTVQFAHHQHVDTARNLGLERRQVLKPRKTGCRAQIGKQTQLAAQTQNGLLRAQVARQIVAREIADGSEQNGIGRPRHLQRFVRQGLAVATIGDGTYIAFEQGQPGKGKFVQHAQRLCRYFRPDPVTCKYRNFHSTIRASRCRKSCRAARTSVRVSASR